MRSPILGIMQHATVINGLDTSIFSPVVNNSLRSEYEIGNRTLIVHVTPAFSLDANHNKGGLHVVELAKRMPEVIFAIIGSTNNISNLPDNIINVGRIEDQHKLAEWYSAADLTLLTSKRETFSMVTAESMCCGTPVVGFCAGGPESIAIKEYSQFVEYGDLDSLVAAIYSMIESHTKVNETIAAEKYSCARMAEEYISIYERML